MKVKSKAAIGRGEELNRKWDWGVGRRAMVEVTPTATTLVAIISFLVRCRRRTKNKSLVI